LDACIRLARADAELRRRMDAHLSGWYGLSRTDFTSLLTLAGSPDRSLRRIDLAEQLGLTASGVTRLLGPLERLGLVERHANPADARVALTSLTPAGEERVRDALETARGSASDLLEQRFSAEEIATLGALLGRLVPSPLYARASLPAGPGRADG
jgi:DNA-binding MarR family transcriptional regulator